MKNLKLKYGDQKKMAELAGVTTMTISRFLKGESGCVSEETAAKIIDAASLLIEARRKVAKNNAMRITKLTKKR